jgi:hypothetical protein
MANHILTTLLEIDMLTWAGAVFKRNAAQTGKDERGVISTVAKRDEVEKSKRHPCANEFFCS